MEEFKQYLQHSSLEMALNLTGASEEELIQNTQIAFEIINSHHLKPIQMTLPNTINEMIIIDLDAPIETIVELNFELADRISILYDDVPKCQVYFSAKRDLNI